MPYVEVWVDDPEDCKGTCDKAHEMGKRRDCAFGLIVDGRLNDAIDVLLRGDLPTDFKVTSEDQARYNSWASGDLDGFLGPADPAKYCITKKQLKEKTA